MIKAVLFDVDGVLIDSEEVWIYSFRDVLAHYGIRVKDTFVTDMIGRTTSQQLDILAEYFRPLFDAEKAKQLWRNWLDAHPFDLKQLVYPEVHDCFSDLKKMRMKTGCCSSSEKEYVEEVLGYANALEMTDIIIGAKEVEKHKPEPDCYLKAAELLQCTPEECLVVEDSVKGIAAGKNAGMKVVARKTDWYEADISNADGKIDDLSQLCDWISRENAGEN